jgi:hypothetical protein
MCRKKKLTRAKLDFLLADIACAKPLYSWSNNEKVAAKIKKIKFCAANFRYLKIFKSWLAKAPNDSKTAEALSKLIGKLAIIDRRAAIGDKGYDARTWKFFWASSRTPSFQNWPKRNWKNWANRCPK